MIFLRFLGLSAILLSFTDASNDSATRYMTVLVQESGPEGIFEDTVWMKLDAFDIDNLTTNQFLEILKDRFRQSAIHQMAEHYNLFKFTLSAQSVEIQPTQPDSQFELIYSSRLMPTVSSTLRQSPKIPTKSLLERICSQELLCVRKADHDSGDKNKHLAAPPPMRIPGASANPTDSTSSDSSSSSSDAMEEKRLEREAYWERDNVPAPQPIMMGSLMDVWLVTNHYSKIRPPCNRCALGLDRMTDFFRHETDLVAPIQAGLGPDCPTHIAKLIQVYVLCRRCHETGINFNPNNNEIFAEAERLAAKAAEVVSNRRKTLKD